MNRLRAAGCAAILIATLVCAGGLLPRGGAADDRACGGEAECRVLLPGGEPGRYYVEAPAGWDGSSPLPVIVWFHGYNGSGAAEIRNRGLVGDWTGGGYLFVAADGRDRTWSTRGAPGAGRDDLAYVRAVIADVMARYPTDPGRIVAAGFSQGASMVWSVACFIGAPFTHFAPVSGDFWQPLPESCDAGPIAMRHTHGAADTTFPVAGRPVEQSHQGNLFRGWDVLRAADGCAAEPDATGVAVGEALCSIWSSCSAGGLQLCFHRGGHMIPPDWSRTTQQWIEGTPAR